MINANFYVDRDDDFVGFIIKGHANTGKYGQDILCSAVSSAVMLTVNTVTDFLDLDAIAKVAGGAVGLKLRKKDEIGSKIIDSLFEHLVEINYGYGKIRVSKKQI